MVGNQPRPIWTTPAASPKRSTRTSGQAAGLQLLAQLQLEAKLDEDDHRQIPARAGRDGLQVPVRRRWRASTASTTACSTWPAATRDRGMAAYSELPAGRVRQPRPMATPPPATSARSAPAFRRHRHRRLGRPGVDASALKESTETAQFVAARRRGRQMGQRYWVIGGE